MGVAIFRPKGETEQTGQMDRDGCDDAEICDGDVLKETFDRVKWTKRNASVDRY